jgi:hypothetical protein
VRGFRNVLAHSGEQAEVELDREIPTSPREARRNLGHEGPQNRQAAPAMITRFGRVPVERRGVPERSA